MCVERKWERLGQVLFYAVEPIIVNNSNTKLFEYYKSLMGEIHSGNIITYDYEIQNKINCIIGKEYDCEMYELDKTEMNYKDFFSFKAMVIVICVFSADISTLTMGESLFLQLNSDLDRFYVELNKKNIKKGQVVDLLLESTMYNSGKELIHNILNGRNDVENNKIYLIYKKKMEQRLKIIEFLVKGV